MTMLTRFTVLTLLVDLLAGGAHAQDDNLLSNGDFETIRDGKPADWPTPDGVTIEQEDGNHFLRMTPPEPDKMLIVYRVVQVKPEHKAYEFSFKARATDVQRGSANWHDARIVLDFKDADGNKVKGGPGHPAYKGSTDGWKERTIRFLVPEGATQLEVMPALFQVKSGTFDLDDLKLVPTDPAPIIAEKEAKAAKRAADEAKRAAKVKPQVPVATADQLPPTLHVEGNQIVNAQGDVIWLQGVAIPSMEWTAAGENILESVQVAIDDWNANVIRLPIKEEFWNGDGDWQKDGGAFYRQLVDDVVNLAGAQGVYTVIDLHRFRAPEAHHAAFWRELANKYRNHPAVLFELFNEPHDVSWQVWRDGGFVTSKKGNKTVIAENNEKLRGFESVGMQALIDAVRDTGAKNIVIAGGLDWGYDLGGVLEGYALDDRDGNGIVYSSHVYPWKNDWQGKFLDVAAKYPIFIGECGAPKERLAFIPESQHEDASTWVPDFLGLVQDHKLHWTAWSFHPKASPVLLKDWSYEPNDHWGKPAKAALNGKKFEMKKMR